MTTAERMGERRRASARARARTRLLALLLVVACPSRAAALCGDGSGDGHVRAVDALAALRLAVSSGYDARVDVFPEEAHDGALTASDARVVLAHATRGTIPGCASAQGRVVVATTASCDFVSGGVAVVDLATREVLAHRTRVTSADAVIRTQQDRVFALNRFGSNTIVELDLGDDLEPLWECSVGIGANPHDIVVVAPDKAYVTRYDSTKLAVVDPSKGPDGCEGFLRSTIDLSTWADDDGFPEMDQMALVGDTLFVALQRLDRDSLFRPRTHGMLVAIDVQTDEVTDSIDLVMQNPFAETKGLLFDEASGLLWVVGPGRLFTDMADGGIERVDPVARRSLGVLASGADLGGDITDFVPIGSGRAYALVAEESFRVSLVEIDLTAARTVSVVASSELLISDVEATERGELWVADRNCFDPGFRVFSIADNAELTSAPINPALAPFNLEFAR